MNDDILLQLDKVINTLDQSRLIKELIDTKNKIYSDKILKLKIDSYHQNPYQESLKKEIYQNDSFMEYKHLENEVYFLILEINQKLKQLIEEKSCKNESN